MNSAFRKGTVWYGDCLAGIIEETEHGYAFTYDTSYLARPDAKPISLTLPLRKEPWQSPTFFPFFDGLIPEGWLLSVAVRNWKLDPRDRMGLLLATCRNCIGTVSVEALP